MCCSPFRRTRDWCSQNEELCRTQRRCENVKHCPPAIKYRQSFTWILSGKNHKANYTAPTHRHLPATDLHPHVALGNGEVTPINGHFLPPPFAAMPGMAAVFTQARSGKLRIPHPHGICITGRKGQGFLGEQFFLIETETDKTKDKRQDPAARDRRPIDNLPDFRSSNLRHLWWDPVLVKLLEQFASLNGPLPPFVALGPLDPPPPLPHRQCRSLNILHAHFLWYSIWATSCFYKTLTNAGPLDVKATPPSGTQHPQNNIVLKHRLGLRAEIKRCGLRLQSPVSMFRLSQAIRRTHLLPQRGSAWITGR